MLKVWNSKFLNELKDLAADELHHFKLDFCYQLMYIKDWLICEFSALTSEARKLKFVLWIS